MSTSTVLRIPTINISATGQVLFGSPSLGVGQSPNLFWDNNQKKLGIATSSPAATLHVSGSLSHRVQRVTTTSYTAGDEVVILVDATSGNVTINLPAVSLCRDRMYHIKKIDTSVNMITIDPNSAELIDGQLTATILTPYESIQIVSDGLGWFII